MANMLQLTDNRNVPVVGSCDAFHPLTLQYFSLKLNKYRYPLFLRTWL